MDVSSALPTTSANFLLQKRNRIFDYVLLGNCTRRMSIKWSAPRTKWVMRIGLRPRTPNLANRPTVKSDYYCMSLTSWWANTATTIKRARQRGRQMKCWMRTRDRRWTYITRKGATLVSRTRPVTSESSQLFASWPTRAISVTYPRRITWRSLEVSPWIKVRSQGSLDAILSPSQT